MADGEFAIGVDIGGSHIACIEARLPGGQFAEASCIDLPVDSKASKKRILETWSQAILAAIDWRKDAHPVGIGFAMPGPFNYRTGVAMFAGNDKYEALYGVDIAAELSLYLGTQIPMRFINDATAFAVGSAWQGAARDYRRSVVATLGTGFGSAFVADGLPIVSGDTVPEHGCLWHVPYDDGIADDYISTRWFERNYRELSGRTARGVKEIADLAQHDPDTRSLFDRYGDNLGEILAPWLAGFRAERLVLGGNVAGALDLFSTSLRAALGRHDVKLDITVCPLKEKAAMLGGARLFDEAFWQVVRRDLPAK